MLTDFLNKIKSFLRENQRDLYLAALVFLMSVASFGLGRLSAVWPAKEPIRIDQADENDQSPRPPSGLDGNVFIERSGSSASSLSSAGNFIASRNGSSYHLPDCPGAKQIKEENKIWFPSEAEAKAAGYKPAGNCPGL